MLPQPVFAAGTRAPFAAAAEPLGARERRVAPPPVSCSSLPPAGERAAEAEAPAVFAGACAPLAPNEHAWPCARAPADDQLPARDELAIHAAAPADSTSTTAEARAQAVFDDAPAHEAHVAPQHAARQQRAPAGPPAGLPIGTEEAERGASALPSASARRARDEEEAAAREEPAAHSDVDAAPAGEGSALLDLAAAPRAEPDDAGECGCEDGGSCAVGAWFARESSTTRAPVGGPAATERADPPGGANGAAPTDLRGPPDSRAHCRDEREAKWWAALSAEELEVERVWATKLEPLAFRVLRQGRTEPMGEGALLHNRAAGVYLCAACAQPLFRSEDKLSSGAQHGWPAFGAALDGRVRRRRQGKGGKVRCAPRASAPCRLRTARGARARSRHCRRWSISALPLARQVEVLCSRCDGHLGHVFASRRYASGERHCVNSASLAFERLPSPGTIATEAEGKGINALSRRTPLEPVVVQQQC